MALFVTTKAEAEARKQRQRNAWLSRTGRRMQDQGKVINQTGSKIAKTGAWLTLIVWVPFIAIILYIIFAR